MDKKIETLEPKYKRARYWLTLRQKRILEGTLQLSKCFSKPSQDKLRSWSDCNWMMWDHNGKNLTILSYNKYQFSAGFDYKKSGKPYYMVITKDHIYSIPL